LSFDWNEYKSTGDWITFANIGDKVVGEILAVRRGTDFNNEPCPELVIRTDEGEKTLTAGQKVLRARLAEEAPQVGDRIAIVYSGVGEAKPGRAPAKLFDVHVQRTGDTPVEQTATGTQPSAVSASDLI
jgi:hypothetical protein